MIVVIGNPVWRASEPPAPAGRACGIALEAVRRGARAELVGRVGEDPAGEALVIALSLAGVGHAAVLRDPARPTRVRAAVARPAPEDEDEASPFSELPRSSAGIAGPPLAGPRLDAADVDLAVKYLAPSGVLVVADDVEPDVVTAAVEAARYAEMRLVVLVAPGHPGDVLPASLPDDATVLGAPPADEADADAFAALVGAYAAALEGGQAPREAFAAAQGTTGWEAAAD